MDGFVVDPVRAGVYAWGAVVNQPAVALISIRPRSDRNTSSGFASETGRPSVPMFEAIVSAAARDATEMVVRWESTSLVRSVSSAHGSVLAGILVPSGVSKAMI
jgi:hypothetical protein